MTTTVLVFGIILTILNIIKPIVYKPCIQVFPAEMSCAFTSSWLVVSILATMPFLYKLMDIELLVNNPNAVILSILKGFLLWFLIKLQQIINKESTSTSVFYTFIAFAAGALLNNIFFGESLPKTHLIAIIGFGILGMLFLIKGDIRRLSIKSKITFFVLVAFVTFFIVSDHIVISKIGWYPHIVISSLAMFIVSLIKGISKKDYKNIFTNKEVVFAGIVYIITEYFIIYSAINIMPVSYVNLFMRLSAPIVMIISALKYKEQSLKNQVIFGGTAIALAAVIIFT